MDTSVDRMRFAQRRNRGRIGEVASGDLGRDSEHADREGLDDEVQQRGAAGSKLGDAPGGGRGVEVVGTDAWSSSHWPVGPPYWMSQNDPFPLISCAVLWATFGSTNRFHVKAVRRRKH